jgi:hypothetical protein
MPRGDRTGPMGMGPMTGRGMGYCGGYGHPGWTAPGLGYGRGSWGGGFGRGRGGGGWGRQHRYHATGLPRWARWDAPPAWTYGYPMEPPSPSREQEIDMLRGEAEWLKEQLDAINRRMDELNQE